ncbi:hypothetical protein GJAV_G00167230 [Gymnothorax javanicus]|nr:hypothetical protein GJAV_G00167230 [Gymnothorax javanicus]
MGAVKKTSCHIPVARKGQDNPAVGPRARHTCIHEEQNHQTMDSMVTGGNVKVLATAIHSLSRIGEELYLESQEDGLALRTVNSSRSAFASFHFAPLFFQRYSPCQGSTFRCKMTVKDCESLQAVFDKESYANVLRAQPRLLVDTVLHFPSSLEEVSVSVNGDRVWLRNHVEEEAEPSKTVLTELSLGADEFEEFTVGCPTSVTFCLKEMRGLLMFAESAGLPISLYIDEPGRPVILSLTESVLEVNFVLATLSEDPHASNHDNNHAECLPKSVPPDDFMNDDINSYLIAMESSCALSPPCGTSFGPVRTREVSDDEEEEEEELCHPPNKKFRSLLFGSVLPASIQTTNATLQSQHILASDSENEEDDLNS